MKKTLVVCAAVYLGLFWSACTDSDPEPEATPIAISAEQLYQEREDNASRYDLNYQGKWVRVTGLVGEIDGGEVRLVVDRESYNLLGGLFLDYVALNDLSQEEQASAVKDQQFTVTCKVGNYILGTINLDDCRT